MTEIAAIISRALGREVGYRFIDRSDREVETVFRERFGTLDRWIYDNHTYAALNDGRVKFLDDRPALRTTMEEFVKDTLDPLIEKARTDGVKPETFLTWSSHSWKLTGLMKPRHDAGIMTGEDRPAASCLSI